MRRLGRVRAVHALHNPNLVTVRQFHHLLHPAPAWRHQRAFPFPAASSSLRWACTASSSVRPAEDRQNNTLHNSEEKPVTPPTRRQLRIQALTASIPMIGFGFMDNSVMIYCGDWIDMTIGVSFGLSTLTAAAFGQLFSDTSGVLFGGVVERIAESLNLPKPGLTAGQLRLASVKRVTTLGAVLGVILGCLLGMVQLLFKDTGKAADLKKQAELESIFQLCMTVGGQDLKADRCSLFLLDADSQELYSLVRAQRDVSSESWRADDTEIRMPVTVGIAGHTVAEKKLINTRNAQHDSRFNNAFDKKTGYVTQSVLCAPIFDPHGEVMGVIQAMNKTGEDGEGSGVFTKHDERMMTMLAEHVSLFVKAVMMDEDED